jgi:hypothetical protein
VKEDWRIPRPRPGQPTAELHLWRTDLDDPRRDADALGLLCSAAERARAGDIADPRRRRRFVLRRALHRLLCGEYALGGAGGAVGTRAASIGPTALFAFGPRTGLGLSIVPVPDCDPGIARLPGLTNRERLAIHRLPAERRATAAAATLAAKEAFGEARGRGLDERIAAVELLPQLGEAAVRGGGFRIEDEGLGWSGHLLGLAPDRLACLVHDGGALPLSTFVLGA